MPEEIANSNQITKSIRDGFGEGLVEAAKNNKEIVVLTADLEESTRVSGFAKEFPERFFEVGVAEQALVTIASGVANYGKIAVATSFSVFVPGRCLEQIRTTIAINNLPVVLVGSHGGFSAGADGVTHQALEDIAITRSLPNMTVVAPADFYEAKKAIISLLNLKAPSYLRLERDASPFLTEESSSFEVGKARVLKEARDPQITFFGYGSILSEVMRAALELENSGIETRVVNVSTIKPLDEEEIIRSARVSKCLVSVEVHQKAGGLGSAIAEVLASNFAVPLEIVAVDDSFGESGKRDELLKKHHLTSGDIKERAMLALQRKSEHILVQ